MNALEDKKGFLKVCFGPFNKPIHPIQVREAYGHNDDECAGHSDSSENSKGHSSRRGLHSMQAGPCEGGQAAFLSRTFYYITTFYASCLYESLSESRCIYTYLACLQPRRILTAAGRSVTSFAHAAAASVSRKATNAVSLPRNPATPRPAPMERGRCWRRAARSTRRARARLNRAGPGRAVVWAAVGLNDIFLLFRLFPTCRV